MANKTHKPTKQELLNQLFNSFCTGIRSKKSELPRTWLQKKGLSFLDLQVGFNSSQFHHRKDKSFRDNFVRIGVLKESDAAVKSPELKAYTCFGGYSIVFPLKDEKGDIVNLFAIQIKKKNQPTEYLNEDGLYPSYPASLTQRLFITTTVLDAASLLQSKVMENRDAVLALYEGELKPQHIQAIGGLKHLQEIIFIQ